MKLSRTVTKARTPGAGPSLGRPSLRAIRVLTLSLLVGALGVGIGLGLRGQASNQPTPPIDLQPLLRKSSPLIVFSEFGPVDDTIWAADPDEPLDRVRLTVVEHAPGYGISPSLSPDGTYVALTALPRESVQSGSDGPAELWLLETATGVRRRLAGDIDLLVTPVWSPSSDSVVVRRSGRQEAGSSGSLELVRVDLSGAATNVASATAGLFPIDFSPDGAWLYYAVLSSSGTDLARAPALGGETKAVTHLSDGFSRDWHLSPDGNLLAYLAQPSGNAGVAFEARVLDIPTKQAHRPLSGAAASHFNPVWDGDGALTIGRLDATGAGGAPVRVGADGSAAGSPLPELPAGTAGFDVPLGWSPDGVHLVVRSFQGASVAAPGPSHVVMVGTDGERRSLSPQSDVTVAGWLRATE